MSSGPLCWRKPTPSMERGHHCGSHIVVHVEKRFVEVLEKWMWFAFQGVWVLHRHEWGLSCWGFDGLHWWCSCICPAFRPSTEPVGADIQSRAVKVINVLWHTAGGECPKVNQSQQRKQYLKYWWLICVNAQKNLVLEKCSTSALPPTLTWSFPLDPDPFLLTLTVSYNLKNLQKNVNDFPFVCRRPRPTLYFQTD